MSLLQFPLTLQSTAGWPVKQTPMYSTVTQTPASGRGELRIALMQFPRWDFVIDLSYIRGDAQGTNTIWQQLLNFYMGVQGAASDWLFTHPWDYNVGSYNVTGHVSSGTFIQYETVIQTGTSTSAELLFAVTDSNTMMIGGFNNQVTPPNNSGNWVGQTSGAIYVPSAAPVLATSQAIATGDGVTTKFTMFRTLVVGGAQDIVQNFIFPPNIYDNGSLVNPANYTGPDQYGTLTFNTAPVAAHIISWSGNFQYRCHFLKDSWDTLEEFYYTFWQAAEIHFRSVIL